MTSMGLLPAQLEFIKAQERLVGFVGGIGSGKTWVAVCKAVALSTVSPRLSGMILEPTFTMARDVALPTIKRVLDLMGIPYRLHETHMTVTLHNGAVWLLRSGDRPENLAGLNLAWAIVDEGALQTERAILETMARVRDPRSGLQQVCIVGTPDGYNHIHRMFVTNADNNTRLIRARTRDNPSISAGYLQTMTAHLSPDERRQYLDGEFVSMSGRVFHAWGDHLVGDPPRDAVYNNIQRAGVLQLWADFNVGEMAWLLVYKPPDEGDVSYIVAECIGSNTGTARHVHEFKATLSEWVADFCALAFTRWSLVDAYTDASGRARKSSASETDVELLEAEGFRVKSPPANPRVSDGVNITNAVLSRGQLKISPRCVRTLAAIRAHGYDKDGQPDKKHGHDHITDAIRYGVHAQYHINPHKRASVSVR